MRFYCVSHDQRMAFTPPFPVTVLSTVPILGQSDIIVPDTDFSSTLSEYSKLFALADQLAESDKNEQIYLMQYRKFIAIRSGGQRSTNAVWAYTASGDTASTLFPSKADLGQLGSRMLIGQPVRVEALARQYATSHPAEDFARFVLALLSSGVFDKQRCARFANCPVLFPAPAMGVFRAGLFKEHMRICKAAWTEFFAYFYVARTDYQRRVGGFLLERLHSYLIFEAISTGEAQNRVHGHQVVVTDNREVARSH